VKLIRLLTRAVGVRREEMPQTVDGKKSCKVPACKNKKKMGIEH
jgi:hypothetical protein